MQQTILIAAFDAVLACGGETWASMARWQEFLVIPCGILAGVALFWLAALYCARQTIRLAGLLAPVFAWVLLADGGHTFSEREVLFAAVTAAVFGLFALFGPGPADWLLVTFFGGAQAKRNHGVLDPNVEG